MAGRWGRWGMSEEVEGVSLRIPQILHWIWLASGGSLACGFTLGQRKLSSNRSPWLRLVKECMNSEDLGEICTMEAFSGQLFGHIGPILLE